MNELEALEVDAHAAYDCVIDVLAESCDVLLQEIVEFGRMSLAMIINVEVGHELARVVDDDGMYYYSEFIRGDEVKTDDIGCCSICLEEFDKQEKNNNGESDDVAVLCCSHVLHADCLVPWIVKGKYTCPLCRSNLISY
ncbi:RING-H2 finger protein ATL18 [Bienertia sinuspersici]